MTRKTDDAAAKDAAARAAWIRRNTEKLLPLTPEQIADLRVLFRANPNSATGYVEDRRQ